MKWILALSVLVFLGCAAETREREVLVYPKYTWSWTNFSSQVVFVECVEPPPCFEDFTLSPSETREVQTSESWIVYNWSPTDLVDLQGAGAVHGFYDY